MASSSGPLQQTPRWSPCFRPCLLPSCHPHTVARVLLLHLPQIARLLCSNSSTVSHLRGPEKPVIIHSSPSALSDLPSHHNPQPRLFQPLPSTPVLAGAEPAPALGPSLSVCWTYPTKLPIWLTPQHPSNHCVPPSHSSREDHPVHLHKTAMHHLHPGTPSPLTCLIFFSHSIYHFLMCSIHLFAYCLHPLEGKIQVDRDFICVIVCYLCNLKA